MTDRDLDDVVEGLEKVTAAYGVGGDDQARRRAGR